MRRFSVLVSLVVVMLLGILALHAQPVAFAQEATPGAGEMEPEGVTFEPVAIASGPTLPSPADMIAIRFSIEPGAGFPLEASDPTAGMLIVESGAFTVRVDADWAVSRRGYASGFSASRPWLLVADGCAGGADIGGAARRPASVAAR